jgi:hypothetical protein
MIVTIQEKKDEVFLNNSKELSINISCLYLTINILLIINNIYGN